MANHLRKKKVRKAINFNFLTYTDIEILSNFVSKQGKILSRRRTGLSSKKQRKVTKLIKIARIAGLLPFVIERG